MAMNPKVKARWVAALRSGEYKQIEGSLKKDGGFCCLGVLCDLYARERGINEWAPSRFWRDADELPNDEVCDWAGFPYTDEDEDGRMLRCSSDYDPEVFISHTARGLSGHNDAGRTFAEIADAIESQL